jgi:alpha-tubulin suppressor-like RCC1 family protein
LGLGFIGWRPLQKATDLGTASFDVPTLNVVTGSMHRCVRLQNFRVRCWGLNESAELGLANTDPLGDDERIVDVGPINLGKDTSGNPVHSLLIASGAQHTCTLLESGDLRCWGRNADGQLGLGFVSVDPTPYVGGSISSVPAVLPSVKLFN